MMLFERNRAARRARLFPELRFAFGPAAPIDIRETAAAFAFHLGAKLCVVVEAMSIGFGGSLGLLVEAFLNLVEKRLCACGDISERRLRLCRRTRHLAPRQHGFARCDVARTNFNSQRHAAHLPVVELESRRDACTLVEPRAQAGTLQRLDRASCRREHTLT